MMVVVPLGRGFCFFRSAMLDIPVNIRMVSGWPHGMVIRMIYPFSILSHRVEMPMGIRPETIIVDHMCAPIRMVSCPCVETFHSNGIANQPNITGTQIEIIGADEADKFNPVPGVIIRNLDDRRRGHHYGCRGLNHRRRAARRDFYHTTGHHRQCPCHRERETHPPIFCFYHSTHFHKFWLSNFFHGGLCLQSPLLFMPGNLVGKLKVFRPHRLTIY
jgi:hypothetical protein